MWTDNITFSIGDYKFILDPTEKTAVTGTSLLVLILNFKLRFSLNLLVTDKLVPPPEKKETFLS